MQSWYAQRGRQNADAFEHHDGASEFDSTAATSAQQWTR
jgi:hypothetical protein